MIRSWICGVAFSLSILAAQTPSESDLLQSADQVLADVVRIRQLESKGPITKGLKSRKQIEAYLRARLEKDYPADKVLTEQKLLIKLGVIPDDTDLEELLVLLFTEQIAGLYDFEAGTLFIADWIPLEIQKPVMAHELMHALQDQHFDLSSLLESGKDNDDAMLAKAALVEGEGFSVMLQYVLDSMGTSFLDIPDIIKLSRTSLAMTAEQYQVLANAPEYLRESLLFPYIYGARFVQAYLRRNSWKDLSKLYAELPSSSEQILHPEKYLDERDTPVAGESLERPLQLDSSWKQIHQNTFGEFSLYLLLKQFIELPVAKQASEGWDGDSVQLYETKAGQLTLFLLSVWDSKQDAGEFFDAYKKLIEKKYPGARSLPPTEQPDAASTILTWETEQDRIQLQWDDTRVEVTEGVVSSGAVVQ